MKQLDLKAVWLFFFSFVWIAFIPIIFIGAVISSSLAKGLDNDGEFLFSFLNWLWIIIPAVLVLCFVWAKLTYHFYRYELTDAGFRKELGVIYKKYVTIPYDRIQNVNIDRGIIERLLGLSRIQIFTAGTGNIIGEGILPGLSREVAEQLRDELIQRARQAKNQGL